MACAALPLTSLSLGSPAWPEDPTRKSEPTLVTAALSSALPGRNDAPLVAKRTERPVSARGRSTSDLKNPYGFPGRLSVFQLAKASRDRKDFTAFGSIQRREEKSRSSPRAFE